MPYAIDTSHKRLPESLDRRRKIPTSEHTRIREMYLAGGTSLRALARKYGVDKRTIQFIVYPERLKAFQEARYRLKPWLNYYNKEKQRESTQSTRLYRKANKNKLISRAHPR